MTGNSEFEALDFRSRGEWRRWLVRNHAKSQGEWVYMYKKGAGCSGLRYHDALDEALCFGWIDGQIKAVDKDKFRQRWTPRRKASIWSDANKRRVRRLITDGRMTDAGLAAVRAAKKAGTWTADSPRRTAPLPADLAAALKSAKPAWRTSPASPPLTGWPTSGGSRAPGSPRRASAESRQLSDARARTASRAWIHPTVERLPTPRFRPRAQSLEPVVPRLTG